MSDDKNILTINIGSSIAKGAGWMVLFKLTERSIGLVSTLILARLLVPEDFGLVAMAMSLVAMTELMGAFGFDIALIQRKDVTRQHFDTAWTYNVILGIAIATILLLLTVPAAEFYREPRLADIVPFLAISSFAQGFENIGVVAFRKELDFRREFRFLLSKKLISFTVTMILAFTLRSYWALVGGILTGKLFGVVMSYVVHPYRPRFCLAGGKDLFHFSKWLLANNFIQFLQNRSTDFILGRTLGAHTLGVYNIAFEIATLPSTELVAPLNRAALPGYAKVAHDLPRLREEFLRVIGMIAMFIFPVGVGLAAVADPAVRLMLGSKWLEAIPLIQIIAVFGTISALQSNIGQILFALGKPKVITLMSGGVLILALPAIYLATTHFGPIGAASIFLSFSLATSPLVHAVFFRIANMHFRDYLNVVWRPFVSALLMGVCVTAVQVTFSTAITPLPVAVELMACILIGVLSFLLFVLIFWKVSGSPHGAEKTIICTLLDQIQKKFLNRPNH